MIILLILISLTILSIIVVSNLRQYSEYELPCWLMTLFFGIISFCMLINIPLERHSIRKKIQALEATRKTFEAARLKTDNIERFSRLDAVIQWNEWIAKEKFNNSELWDIYVPDEIENVKPIE